jgi:anaerobic selenocysteine-containing dehydrogenase
VKGERSTNYLFIHPRDAQLRNLSAGDMARVSVGKKSVEVPVKLDEDMLPGTISVPHGWGHQQADGLRVARNTAGANVNVIIPDGPASIEPGSGMSHMNGVIAEVARA